MLEIAWLVSQGALAGEPVACEDARRDLEGALGADIGCRTAALLAARDGGGGDCIAPVLADRGLSTVGSLGGGATSRVPRLPVEKSSRDVLAPQLEVFESTNFAVRFGPGLSGQADPADIAAAFERAWAAEIEAMGYPPPYGTDAYRFNVYVAGTGNGAPDDENASGYYWVDDDQYGYIVVSLDTATSPSWLVSTAAHEFFHAVQDTLHTYRYEGQGAWYWEATACWIEGEVVAESDDYAAFLPGYAWTANLPVNHFRYPDGSMEGYHQYGAFVFVRDITERNVGDVDIVRRSWVESSDGDDPLDVLDGLLRADGGDGIQAAYFDFAARMGTFDYADELAYQEVIDAWGGWNSSQSTRPQGTVFSTGGTYDPDEPPRTYGSNYYQLIAPPPALQVTFAGEAGPTWDVRVVWQRGADHTQAAVRVDGEATEIVGADGATDAWIVVSAVDGLVDDGFTYTYTLDVQPVDPEVPDTGDSDTDDEGRRCGCAADPGANWGAGAILLSLLAATGRRRGRSR